MDPVKTGAMEVVSPPTKESATVMAESLRAAQDSAEAARKESASLREMLEETQSQSQEFQEKLSTFEKRMNKEGRSEKIETREDLVRTLRAQAAAGERDAVAVLESAREIAREEFQNLSTKARIQESARMEDSFLANKAKEHGMDENKFTLMLDKYAAPYMTELPHVTVELAYRDWQKEAALTTRETRIKEKEIEMGLYRDDGAEGEAGGTKKVAAGQKANWRDAKTSIEKRAALDDI